MDKLRAEFDLGVKWVAFPLHPETPPQGQSLERLFAGRDFDVNAMVARLKYTAQGLGLPFGRRTMSFNSRRAQELGKWAENMGKGDEFHLAAFRAYFARGLNLYRNEVLREILAEVSLPPDEGITALEAGEMAPEVDADWAHSRECGISAVPSFQMAGRQMAGAQPYPMLAQMVRDAISGKPGCMTPLA